MARSRIGSNGSNRSPSKPNLDPHPQTCNLAYLLGWGSVASGQHKSVGETHELAQVPRTPNRLVNYLKAKDSHTPFMGQKLFPVHLIERQSVRKLSPQSAS